MAGPSIGIVGLGAMELPTASNLVDADYDVIGDNRVSARGDRADSAVDTARRADVLITCLTNSTVVIEVTYQDDDILEGIESGSILAAMSNISPDGHRRPCRRARAPRHRHAGRADLGP